MARTPITPTAASDYLSFLNTVPTVTDYQYTPSFVAKDIDFKALDHNQADFISIYDKETDEANKSFQKVGEERNKILNMRADNAYQQQKLKGLQDTYGMNQLFDLNEEDFTNSSKIKSIENSTARLLSDKNTLEIMREQSLSDKFEKDHESIACTGKDANPLLCQMGREDLKRYKGDVDGSFSANALNASNYAPMDIDKSIKDDMASIPEEKFLGGIIDQNGYVLVPEMEKKSKALVADVLTTRLKEPRFVNNLKAMGYDTPEKMNQLMNEYANTYFKENLVKHEMKMRPIPRAAAGGSGAPLLSNTPSASYLSGANALFDRIRTLKANSTSVNTATSVEGALNDPEFEANMAWIDSVNPQEGLTILNDISGVLGQSDNGTAKNKAEGIQQKAYSTAARLGNPRHLDRVLFGVKDTDKLKNIWQSIKNGNVDDSGVFTSNYDQSIATTINRKLKEYGGNDPNIRKKIVENWKKELFNQHVDGFNYTQEKGYGNNRSPWDYYKTLSGAGGNSTPTAAKQPSSPINKPKVKAKDLLN